MRLIASALFAIALLGGVTSPLKSDCNVTYRCVCTFSPNSIPDAARVSGHYDAAEAVLLAMVTDTTRGTRLLPSFARLQVERWWKGGASDTLRVAQYFSTSTRTSCDYPLRVGVTYILFLHRSGSGWLQTSRCAGTIQRSHVTADALLEYLGDGSAPVARRRH